MYICADVLACLNFQLDGLVIFHSTPNCLGGSMYEDPVGKKFLRTHFKRF